MTNEKEEKKKTRKERKGKEKLKKKTFQSYIDFNINFETLVFAGVAIWNLLTPQLGYFVILSTLK